MTLPNFIIVGVQKAGTTTLYASLTQHPQIGMSRIKEPNFFGSSGRRWAVNLKEYEALFDGCQGKTAIGEATTTYFYDPPALEAIRQTLGAAVKIVVILRNPARRAFSHWGHLRYVRQRETLSFEEALTREGQRSTEGSLDPNDRPGTFRYFDGGLYTEKLQRCFELFGREQVHVMLLEEVIQSPSHEFARLFTFLGVDSTFEPTLERDNAAAESRAPWLTRLIVQRPRIVDRLFHTLPIGWQRRLFQGGEWVFQRLRGQRRSTTTTLPDALYAQLMRDYADDIRALETLLHRDLNIWRIEL